MKNRKVLKSALRVTAGLGVMAALTLAAPTGGSVSSAAADTGDDCVPSEAPANARTLPGHEDADPNTLTDAQQASIERTVQKKIDAFKDSGRALPKGKVKIKTYIHVITTDEGAGGVSNNQIKRQMKVINAGFAGKTAKKAAGGKFKFVLKKTTRTANTSWYNWYLNPDDTEPAEMIAAKTALREGTKKDLNVYVAGLQGGLLGYATFPGGDLNVDGLVILNESMPGGSASPYNKGDTATHEIGHWMGLYHTFQGSCSKKNDHVGDTPAQKAGQNIFKCNPKLDTCKAKGKDPIHNFMNYASDACINMFTKGQQKRMNKVWAATRA